ncbi:MAG: hypothetical protein K0U98_15705 [Deltaproteobacteria bacterium]|nr:hypothetical protein [Deltaproteobacteria bacterium]
MKFRSTYLEFSFSKVSAFLSVVLFLVLLSTSQPCSGLEEVAQILPGSPTGVSVALRKARSEAEFDGESDNPFPGDKETWEPNIDHEQDRFVATARHSEVGERKSCEIGLGTARTIEIRDASLVQEDVFCFRLGVHRTVVIETAGFGPVSGDLFVGFPALPVVSVVPTPGGDLRLVKTLAPGDYALVLRAQGILQDFYGLRLSLLDFDLGKSLESSLWSREDDYGDHCQVAGELDDGTASGVLGSYDVDAFSWWMPFSGELQLDLHGLEGGHVEVLNQACRTIASISGLSWQLGASIPRLPAGRYFLYVSGGGRVGGSYRLELWPQVNRSYSFGSS